MPCEAVSGNVCFQEIAHPIFTAEIGAQSGLAERTLKGQDASLDHEVLYTSGHHSTIISGAHSSLS